MSPRMGTKPRFLSACLITIGIDFSSSIPWCIAWSKGFGLSFVFVRYLIAFNFQIFQFFSSIGDSLTIFEPIFLSVSCTSSDKDFLKFARNANLCPIRRTNFALVENLEDGNPIGSLCLCNGANVLGFRFLDLGFFVVLFCSCTCLVGA